MGITGLIPFIKNNGDRSAIRKAHLIEFKGKRVGIDAYAWLHKGVYTCYLELFMGKPTKKYVQFCMKLVNVLLSFGIIPVLVFDGENMPFKVVDEMRRDARRNAKKQAADLIATGRQHQAHKFMVQAIDVTHEMAYNFITAAREQNIDCIVAPYEADAQLAYLLKEHFIDLIITEDSDLIVFGCEKIFFKMAQDGTGELYERKQLEVALKAKSTKFKEFSFDKFRHAAIMSGCDYVKNLSGIGLVKAWKFINCTQIEKINIFLKKIPSYLNLRLTITNEYIKNFLMAEMSFLYQYVFDPIMRERVTFSEVQEDHKDAFRDFSNNFKPIEVDALELALGNIDRNNRIFGNFSVNKVAITSIFKRKISKDALVKVIPRQSGGFQEIRTGKKRPILKENTEINTDLDDEGIINLYREKEQVSQKENILPLEPAKKKPRKCKFVKCKEEDHVSSSFFSNDKYDGSTEPIQEETLWSDAISMIKSENSSVDDTFTNSYTEAQMYIKVKMEEEDHVNCSYFSNDKHDGSTEPIQETLWSDVISLIKSEHSSADDTFTNSNTEAQMYLKVEMEEEDHVNSSCFSNDKYGGSTEPIQEETLWSDAISIIKSEYSSADDTFTNSEASTTCLKVEMSNRVFEENQIQERTGDEIQLDKIAELNSLPKFKEFDNFVKDFDGFLQDIHYLDNDLSVKSEINFFEKDVKEAKEILDRTCKAETSENEETGSCVQNLEIAEPKKKEHLKRKVIKGQRSILDFFAKNEK